MFLDMSLCVDFLAVADPIFGCGVDIKKNSLSSNKKFGIKYIIHILFKPSGGTYLPWIRACFLV